MARPFARKPSKTSHTVPPPPAAAAAVDTTNNKAPKKAPTALYFEQEYQHVDWKLIKTNLPFVYQNNKFHLVSNRDNRTVLKTFDSTYPEALLEFMLQHGIPNWEQLPDDDDDDFKDKLLEAISLVYMPKEDLSNARNSLNGFGKEDLKILQDGSEEIITLLKEFGFFFAHFSDAEKRIYLPKAWEATHATHPYGTHGVHYFSSLDEVRAHVRSHEHFAYRPTDESIRGSGSDNGGEDGETATSLRRSSTRRNSAQDVAQRKKMLSLRIWAATSKQPLPVFDWSQWGGKAVANSTVASTVQRRRGEEQKKPSGPQVAAAAAATASQQEPEDRKPNAKKTTAAQETSARGGGSKSRSSTSATAANKKKTAPKPALAQQSAAAAAVAQEPARVSLPPKRSSIEITTTGMAKRPKIEDERASRADSDNSDSEEQNFTGRAVESNENISIEEIQARNVALNSSIDRQKERLKREELGLQRRLKTVRAELEELEMLKEE